MNKVTKTALTAISEEFCKSKPPDCIAFRFSPKDISGWKKCRKRLAASKDFSLKRKGERVYGKNGHFIDGLAKWGKTLAFDEGNQHFRYRTLWFRHNGEGFGFAIRATGNGVVGELPGIDLEKPEIKLMLKIADETSESGKDNIVELPINAQNRINRALKVEPNEYPEEKLSNVLRNDFVRNTFLVGILGGLQCYKNEWYKINFLVNFLLPRGNGIAAAESVQRILRVLDFTILSPYNGCATIDVKERADLYAWEKRRCKLTLLRYSGEKAIRPVWREAEAAALEERNANFPALPILLGSSSLPPEHTFEIILPPEVPLLTQEEIKILRAAAAYLLSERDQIMVFLKEEKCWREVTGIHYLLTFPAAYMQSFARAVGKLLFSDRILEDSYLDACSKNAAEIQAQLASEQKILDGSLRLLMNPSQYIHQILEKPLTNADAEKELTNHGVAFQYTHKGKQALCFSEQSLLRLLSSEGLTESLFERFMHVLRAQGIIEHKTESIHFKNSSNGRFITIWLQKHEDFTVSAISERNPTEEGGYIS